MVHASCHHVLLSALHQVSPSILLVQADSLVCMSRQAHVSNPLLSVQVPDDTIVILLGLVFCCVNPLVCLAALLYFLIKWTLEKYNFLYVWRERYQTGGKVRPLCCLESPGH